MVWHFISLHLLFDRPAIGPTRSYSGVLVAALNVVISLYGAVDSVSAADSKNIWPQTLSEETLRELAISRQRWREKIGRFTKEIKSNPRSSYAYAERADAYRHTGQFRKALRDYTTAIELSPDDAQLYAYRALVYGALKQYHRELVDDNTWIRLQPNSDRAFLNRGLLYGQLGRYKESVADCTRSIELKPSYGAYCQRADAYEKLGMLDLAKADREVARHQPSYGIIGPSR